MSTRRVDNGSRLNNTPSGGVSTESDSSDLIPAGAKYATAIFDMPSFGVKLHWHERDHADPANRWLRHTFSALFTE